MTLFTARCLCGPRVSRRTFASDALPARKRRADPTGTSPISRSWSRDLDRRWNALKRAIPDAIRARVHTTSMISHSMLTGQDPIRAFQSWLDEALRQIILGSNGYWILSYVRQASDMGVQHARSTAGESSLPVVDRTNLIQSLAITELQGIMEAVSQQAVRAFGAVVLGRDPVNRATAGIRTAIDQVGVRRGHLLINFMTVRAFNASAIDGYRAQGLTHVGTRPEGRSPRSLGDAFDPDQPRDKQGQWAAAIASVDNAPQHPAGSGYMSPTSIGLTVANGVTLRSSRNVTSLYKKAVKEGRVQDVPLNDLKLAQAYLNRDKIKQFLLSAPKNPITVLHQDGQFYAIDGTHRVAAAKLRGDMKISAVVISVDSKKDTRDASDDDEDLVEVLTAGDDDVCPECEDISNDGPYTLDEADGLIPAHPSCLLPGSTVEGRVLAALKSSYSGPAFEIETRSGRRLRVTGQHPILTSLGPVAAQDLREGMQLLGKGRDVRDTASSHVDSNDNNSPAIVEQVYDALRTQGLCSVTPSSDDLHGDARFVHGDVDIVAVDRRLLRHVHAQSAQGRSQLVLPLADACFAVLSSLAAVDQLGHRSLFAPGRGPGSRALPDNHPSALLHSGPLENLRLGTRAHSDIKFPKLPDEDVALYSSLIRDSFERDPGLVSLDDIGKLSALVHHFGSSRVFDEVLSTLDDPIDHATRYLEFLGDLMSRQPGLVELDDVVSLRSFHYDGPVYDLQTTTGCMVAQGLFEYNCRCAFVPWDDQRFASVREMDDSATHIASGVMITADNTGRTLFLRRSAKHGDLGGTWAFPAGAVEPGETVEQAAARETREEIGYDPSGDMEQAHRSETNGVDFTTYAHATDREFRPHLNNEHDDYKWAHLEEAPEPLHPGVARTLDELDEALRVRDESVWSEEDHPRDKTGKFTEAQGAALEKDLDNKGVSAVYYSPTDLQEPGVHKFSAGNMSNNVEKVKEILEPKGFKNTEANPNVFTLNTNEMHEQAKPVAAHPLEKHLSNVAGNSAERIAMRASMKGLKHGDPMLQDLQERHNASLLKQHQKYVKQGKTEKADEFAAHLDKFSKSYGIANPLKSPTPAALASLQQTAPAKAFGKLGVAKPEHDLSTPHGNLAAGLESNGITAHVTAAKEVWVTNVDAAKAADVAKWHPKMEANADGTVFKEKGATETSPWSQPSLPSGHSAKPLDFKSLNKIGDKMGSNPGGVYQDPKTSAYYYIKSMDKAHADNELLAAKLYALTGAKTLDYVPVKPDGDVHYVATKFEGLDKNNVSQLSPMERSIAQKDLATHAWLANWDAAGTGGDNQGVKGGIVKTLDVGGALEYRAKGTPKGDAFGTKVPELDTLRDASKNPDAAKLFGDMTDAKIKESIGKVQSVPYSAIIGATQSVYGPGAKASEMADKLDQRKDDLRKQGKALGAAPKAPPADDLSHMDDEQQRVYWFNKQVGAGAKGWLKMAQEAKNKTHGVENLSVAEIAYIKAFTGPYSKVNAAMRDGHMDESALQFKHIMNGALDKMPPYTGNAVYRKINLSPEERAKYVPGTIAHWKGFNSTAKNTEVWSGDTHFVIHNPKSGADVDHISHNQGEAEVIMPADTYYRVLSVKKNTNAAGKSETGVTQIAMEEVLPFGKKKKAA